MPKVFISYSHKDKDFVGMLAEGLQRVGHDVWWDTTDIQGGDEISDKITNAIASSKYVIVVLTPDSIKSKWVKSEYTEALNQNKKIVPIMLRQCKLPITLNIFSYSDFTREEDYQDNLNKLLSSLGNTGKLSITSPKETPLHLTPTFPKYRVIIIIVILILLFALIWAFQFEPPTTSTVTPMLSSTIKITNALEFATSPTTFTATRTNFPKITPTPIPEIIITYSDGRITSHKCPSFTAQAMLNNGEKVELEFSAAMTENEFEELVWWTFVSGSEERIGIGRTVFYSQANAGGIINIRLNNIKICTFTIQAIP